MVFGLIGKMLLEHAVEVGVKYVVPKATDYMEKNIPKAIDYAGENIPKAFHYAKEKIPKMFGGSDSEVVEEYYTEEEINRSIIFDIVNMINHDKNILNNKNDKANAKFIESELEKNSDFYKFIDINVDFVEEIIKSIRYDVKCRYSLLEELKKRPQIIRQKTSAITKTVCANLGLANNEEVKNALAINIDIVKKILELHRSGASNKEIFQQTCCVWEGGFAFAFEFEIKHIIKVLGKVQE